MKIIYTICLFVSMLAMTNLSAAEDWLQWRGNNLDGISSEKNIPVQWDSENNVAWRVELPGPAGASPIVTGDRIFLTSSNESGELLLMCFGTDGEEQWSEVIGSGDKRVRGDEGNFASPSPSTDGEHVWAMIGNGTLVCFTVEGKPVWKKDLQKEYGKFEIAFGMTSTPLLYEGALYLQLIHGVMRDRSTTSQGHVIALDAATGNEIWYRERNTHGAFECKHSYASPIIYKDEEQAFLISHGADFVIAHSLEDGEELWRCGGINDPGEDYHPTLRFVASPGYGEGIIVVPSAKNGPVLALKPDGKGDISDDKSAHVWRRDRGTPDVPSPLILDGLVYLCRENGVLICADAKTGETVYEERTVDDRHRASPVYADGKIYLIAHDGIITVVKAGREFEILSKNDMGEPISASLAIADGRIYVRSYQALYAVEE